MRIYMTWIGRFTALYGDVPVHMVTPAQIEAYAARMREYEASTVNIALRSVRTWLAWLVERGEIPASPFRGIRMAAARPRSYPPYVTREQLETVIIPAAGTDRLRAAIALAYYCGLRRGECAALRWTDVDFVRGEIRIVSRDGHETKTGRARTVPMLNPVRAILGAFLARRGREPVTPPDRRRAGRKRAGTGALRGESGTPDAERGSEHVYPGAGTRKYATYVMTHAWRRAQTRLRTLDPGIPYITFHGLRHSYATWLASHGLPIVSLQLALGHSDITMTMVYTHVQPATVHDQIRDIAGRVEGILTDGSPVDGSPADGDTSNVVRDVVRTPRKSLEIATPLCHSKHEIAENGPESQKS